MPAPKLTLVSHDLCPFVQRARIVLEEKSIPHELEFIDLADKPAWFLAVSPLGKVPVLLVDETPLFESAPIAEYLDEITPGSLHPSDAFQKAQHRAWIEFASSTLSAIGTFYSAQDPSSFENSIATLKSRFRTLETALGEGPYFAGARFSLVDAAFGPVFRYFDVIDRYRDFGFLQGTPRVAAWRRSLSRRPSVRRAAIGDYGERLHRFFIRRNSELTRLIVQRECA